jgi:hypothetical protein
MKKTMTLLKSIAILAGFALTNTANAAFPIGLWQLEQYDFVTKAKINTMLACIYTNGTIKMGGSIPFNDWEGNWKRTGDLILLRMKTINSANYGAYSVVASNQTVMTSYGQSWTIYNTASGFYTTSVWTFKNSVC